MALAKLLSNPVGPLKTLLEGPHWIRQDSTRSPLKPVQDIGARHRRAGWVVEAIVRVLADQQKPMQAKEIHTAVEALLGRPVCWSSVKAALAANVSGPSPRFVRVAKGRYRLS
jgi:HB1, ASXL, restriction endonuclease HTH domain